LFLFVFLFCWQRRLVGRQEKLPRRQGDERAKRVMEQLRKGEAAGLTINEKCGSEILMRKFVYERMLY
jgi:hypothetical protein